MDGNILDVQDKLLRTLVLTCLSRTVTTYLLRLGPRLPQDKIQRWLSKTVKPILLNLRKGNFGFPEQQVSLLCIMLEFIVQGLSFLCPSEH